MTRYRITGGHFTSGVIVTVRAEKTSDDGKPAPAEGHPEPWDGLSAGLSLGANHPGDVAGLLIGACDRLARLVREDIEAAPPQDPGPAIARLYETGGLRSLRPQRMVLDVIEARPELFEQLSDEQQESIRAMVLAHVIALSADVIGGDRVIDGRKLVHELQALPRVFPEDTERALYALAEHANRERIAASRPSELARALLADGKVRAALLNGGIA